jgi:hypothetical protein
MKKQTLLSSFALTVIAVSLLLHACSMNAPDNSADIITTSTPTASSGSSNNSVTATATSSLAEIASPPVTAPPIQDLEQNLDPCAFFTSAEAEPIVGTALIDITPGNDVDEVTGGPLEYCTYKGDDVALVVSFVQSNAVQGSLAWQDQLPNMAQATDSDATVTEIPGLGERSFWGVTEHSAGWFVAKYPYVFALVVGGNIGYSEDYKADLTTLAQKIIDQLP